MTNQYATSHTDSKCFEVGGRGTAVVIDSETDLPLGRCLQATIHRRDGSTQEYKAWKEWLLLSSNESLEIEAFLIVDVAFEEVPDGGAITLQIGAN